MERDKWEKISTWNVTQGTNACVWGRLTDDDQIQLQTMWEGENPDVHGEFFAVPEMAGWALSTYLLAVTQFLENETKQMLSSQDIGK